MTSKRSDVGARFESRAILPDEMNDVFDGTSLRLRGGRAGQTYSSASSPGLTGSRGTRQRQA